MGDLLLIVSVFTMWTGYYIFKKLEGGMRASEQPLGNLTYLKSLTAVSYRLQRLYDAVLS